MSHFKVHEEVQDYYGKTLQKSDDLKTNACCTTVQYPDHIKKIMSQVHDEVMSKYYGCGLTIPTTLKATKVLDLGSGSGRDCYLLSNLVGEKGFVIGVDMTKEQLDVSKRHINYHTEKFGFKKPNVKFLEGNIEKLEELDLEDNFFDVIISNCVINLTKDKEAVLRQAYKKLKPGGEMYFSDVYCDRRIPEKLQEDAVLYGECLSGALYWKDFLRLSKKVGFTDPRAVESEVVTIDNKEIQKKLIGYNFYSVTYRLFKITELETNCEEYGQAVIYRGGVEEMSNAFVLDNHHVFEKNKTTTVCGNTYLMLSKSRFKEHFDFIGDFSKHFGSFEKCDGAAVFSSGQSSVFNVGANTILSDPSSCC